MLLDKAVWQGGVLCELFYPGGFADPDPLSPRSGFERADAVDRRGHLLCSRQTQLPRMPPEVSQRAETVLPDGAERPVYHRLDLAARVPGGELADDAGDGLGLTGLGELLQVREVHLLPTELYSVGASAPCRFPPTAPEVYRGGSHPAPPRPARRTRFRWYPGREPLAHLVCSRGGVLEPVVLHEYHTVGHVQVVAHAADDHDRRDA